MKNIFAIIIIILTLILGDRAGAYIISSLFNLSNDKIARLYSKDISEKIVILGNSRAFRHFDYNFMEKKFDQKIINLSEPGYSAVLSAALLKDFIDFNGNPKIIIIEATSTLNDNSAILALRPFQSNSFRIEKLIKDNYYNIFFWAKISHLYRFNNGKTLNIIHKIFFDHKTEILEGTILNNQKMENSTKFFDKRYEKKYFSQNINALKEIINYCEKNRIDLRIIISPIFPKHSQYQAEINFIKLNLPNQYIWDFSILDIVNYDDFYDTGHLNRKGVRKFMHALEEKKFFKFYSTFW